MTDPNDKTFRQAVIAALPRYRDALDEVMALWREIEPSLRAYVAKGDTLTEMDWYFQPDGARTLYETLKHTFADLDTNTREE